MYLVAVEVLVRGQGEAGSMRRVAHLLLSHVQVVVVSVFSNILLVVSYQILRHSVVA